MQPRNNSILTQTGLVIFGTIILVFLIFSVFDKPDESFVLTSGIDFNNNSGILGAQISVPTQYSEPLIISVFNNTLSIMPVNAQNNATPESIGENIIKYTEAYAETDIVQTRKSTGLKEDIVLKAPGHPEEFVYQINIQEYDVEKDAEGNFVFYAKGKKGNNLYRIFTILAPFMIDADDKQSSTNDVKVSLTTNGILTINPDIAWLSQAIYPVILDPTVEINILNVHSHPQQGDNWEVSFTTQGQADLKIIPNDQSTIDDDEFVSLWCGQEQRMPQILPGDVIYYPNWECSEVAKVIHYTKKAAPHHLIFQFGEETADAYNSPGTANQKNFQFFNAGDELPHWDASSTPTISSMTNSGANSDDATPALALPAYASGDLVVLHLFIDDDDTIDLTSGTGPLGETIYGVANGDSGAGAGPALAVAYFIGGGTQAATTIETAVSGGGEQWLGRAYKILAGGYNPDNPIDSVSAVGGALSDSNDSPTTAFVASANAGNGLVVAALAADADPWSTTESGWTQQTNQDIGAVGATIWTRDTAASTSESIGSTIFDLLSTNTDTTSNFVYIINAPLAADGRTSFASAGADASLDVSTDYGWQFRIENTGDVSDDQYKIQYRHIEGTNTWTDVTDASDVIVAALTGDFVNGADVPEYIKGSGTYVSDNNAALESTGTLTLSANLAADNSFEGHLNFQIVSADVSDGNTIQLRVVYADGTELEAYTDTPTITCVGGTYEPPPEENNLLIRFRTGVHLRQNLHLK